MQQQNRVIQWVVRLALCSLFVTAGVLVPCLAAPEMDTTQQSERQAPYRIIGQAPPNPPQRFVYFHLDHLGSPRLVLDESGNTVSQHHYLAFGEELPAPASPDPTMNRKAFTGHERDSETSLDYMMARYYSSSFGRFMEVDPGNDTTPEDPQSWNNYAYVRNNPLNLIDKDGRLGGPPGLDPLGAVGHLASAFCAAAMQVPKAIGAGLESATQAGFDAGKVGVSGTGGPLSVKVDSKDGPSGTFGGGKGKVSGGTTVDPEGGGEFGGEGSIPIGPVIVSVDTDLNVEVGVGGSIGEGKAKAEGKGFFGTSLKEMAKGFSEGYDKSISESQKTIDTEITAAKRNLALDL